MGCHWLDPRYLAELAALDPPEVCRRAKVEWLGEVGCYRLPLLNRIVEVHPQQGWVVDVGADGQRRSLGLELALAVVFYLLRAEDRPLTSRWISEKDLKGGTTFFRGPHALPLVLVAERYGQDLEGFLAAARSLGGEAVAHADATVELRVLPRVPLRVVLWLADDEFPADARMLFDASLEHHLPLDVVFGLGVDVCRLLAGTTASWGPVDAREGPA